MILKCSQSVHRRQQYKTRFKILDSLSLPGFAAQHSQLEVPGKHKSQTLTSQKETLLQMRAELMLDALKDTQFSLDGGSIARNSKHR